MKSDQNKVENCSFRRSTKGADRTNPWFRTIQNQNWILRRTTTHLNRHMKKKTIASPKRKTVLYCTAVGTWRWNEVMLVTFELMLKVKCQIEHIYTSTNTIKRGFLLPTKCVERYWILLLSFTYFQLFIYVFRFYNHIVYCTVLYFNVLCSTAFFSAVWQKIINKNLEEPIVSIESDNIHI